MLYYEQGNFEVMAEFLTDHSYWEVLRAIETGKHMLNNMWTRGFTEQYAYDPTRLY